MHSMLSLAIVLSILMLLVFYFDVTSYLIPNWLVGLVLLCYPAIFIFSPEVVDWKMGLIAFGISFGIGLALFSAGWMGGGDVKLFAACCLWTGGPAIISFLFFTGLLGGVLALGLLIGRPIVAYYAARYRPDKPLPRVLMHGEPAPYGLAIAGAFLMVLWFGNIPGLKPL